MHTIDLIRHAESAWVEQAEADPIKRFGGRMNEVDLSDKGRSQATQFGRFVRLHGITPLAIYSSPAVRTLQTHELSAIETGIDVEPIIDNRLQERSYGNWTGQPRSIQDEPENRRAREQLGNDFTPPGGESINMVRQRATQALLAMTNDNPPGHIMVHTHRNLIKAVAGPELGWSPEQITEGDLAVVSLTRFQVESGRLSLLLFNQPTL